MDIITLMEMISPFSTAITSFVGIIIAWKLMDYRLGQLEESFKKFQSSIEKLITVEHHVDSLEKDIEEFKGKESKDKDELHDEIEKIKIEINEMREKQSEIQRDITRLEITLENLRNR